MTAHLWAAGQPLSVLIVDDEPTNLTVLETLVRAVVQRRLPQAALSCDRAHSGVEALQLMSRKRYAAVLLDLMMPELDGFGVLATLRERGDRTPIIVVTAVDRSLLARVPLQQVVAILPKPIESERLAAVLLAALEQAALTRP
ncbi:MAG: response regulator [Planctomycetota bacterium]|nr:response regulator [Planctomycetota bacterium]